MFWHTIPENILQGFRQGGGGGGGGGLDPPTQLHPPCWQEKLKYSPYFTVISVKIGHFKHQHLKTLFFSPGGGPPGPPSLLEPPSQTFLSDSEVLVWFSSNFAHTTWTPRLPISSDFPPVFRLPNCLVNFFSFIPTPPLLGIDVHFGVTVLWPTFGSVLCPK